MMEFVGTWMVRQKVGDEVSQLAGFMRNVRKISVSSTNPQPLLVVGHGRSSGVPTTTHNELDGEGEGAFISNSFAGLDVDVESEDKFSDSRDEEGFLDEQQRMEMHRGKSSELGRDKINRVFLKLVGKRSTIAGLAVFPLYAGLSRADQDLVFSPLPRGKRKVVISTNIAETSLTLEGVVYVVDSGFSKQRFYNPLSDIENLVVAPISKASARQRAGRAGRVRPGKCYRLYTEEHFIKEISAEGIPEMQRSNLVSCVIQLKALGIDNILGFDWPASPPPETMIRALEVLYALGILDEDAKLTSPIGFQVAEIPLDPMISKMILSGNLLGCSEEVIIIAAILSVQSIWVSVRSVKELDEAKLRFAAAEGDHVTYLNVYKGFLKSGKSSQWCHKNFINYHAMVGSFYISEEQKKVTEVRQQLSRVAQRLGLVLKSCESDMRVLRKAVTAGFFANACRLEVKNVIFFCGCNLLMHSHFKKWHMIKHYIICLGEHSCIIFLICSLVYAKKTYSQDGMYKTLRSSHEVYIHPSSVLFRLVGLYYLVL
ncbi:hypothetical protein GIB67_039299 [Kingdonia uniflora]|uniref:Helicase C-terminal domain-containing protein n=1 Tax=Kingdonia uniflora TaxID=39325 RepID=A0A7J7MML8_9MAGN|nr:hypothetical protein GIB67_039299 [Kingdonia uniflora]